LICIQVFNSYSPFGVKNRMAINRREVLEFENYSY